MMHKQQLVQGAKRGIFPSDHPNVRRRKRAREKALLLYTVGSIGLGVATGLPLLGVAVAWHPLDQYVVCTSTCMAQLRLYQGKAQLCHAR
jgi:hypothetical protein